MELFDIIKIPDQFLEQYAIFKGLKFIMAVYLVIIVLNIVILLYFLIVKKHYLWDFSFGRTMPRTRGVMNKRWQEIVNIVQKEKSEQYKMAVVEARDILFEAFFRIGYEGDSLEKQLNLMIGHQVDNLDELKDANLIAENIINDVNYELSENMLKETLLAFGKALQEIEAIGEIGLEE